MGQPGGPNRQNFGVRVDSITKGEQQTPKQKERTPTSTHKSSNWGRAKPTNLLQEGGETP